MANVELSNEEWNVLSNAEFLLTKNAVSRKMQEALSDLARQYQQIVTEQPSVWSGIMERAPKISRGEQYGGLPYMVLDFPREFGQENIFAIRSFFWWGRFFSISLLLQGAYLKVLAPAIQSPLLQGWQWDTSLTPWNHNPDVNNNPVLEKCDKDEITDKPFLKIYRQLPLGQWRGMNDFFLQSFQQLWLAINFPGGGTGPLPDDPTSGNRP